MGYSLRADEPIPGGIRRLVREQIDRASDELTDDTLDRHKGVHQARKRFKKIRAVLRLVRPELGTVYRVENNWFREIAGRLSEARDAQVLIETLDALRCTFDDQVTPDAFASVQTVLVERREAITASEAVLDRHVAEVVEDLRVARLRVEDWPLTTNSFATLRPGLEQIYRRGRKALARAYAHPVPEEFHEWRKHVKDHWYHIRLLQRLWPKLMRGYCESLKDLAEMLGDDHDLSVLRQTLLDRPKTYGNERELEVLLGLIGSRQAELRAKAETCGQRIFAEKPALVGERLMCYWEVWHAEERRSSRLLVGMSGEDRRQDDGQATDRL